MIKPEELYEQYVYAVKLADADELRGWERLSQAHQNAWAYMAGWIDGLYSEGGKEKEKQNPSGNVAME